MNERGEPGQTRELIEVKATFSLGKKPPFHERYSAETSVGTVLEAVRVYFEAKDEPNVVWYLSARDLRQDNAATLEQIAGGGDEISFRLVKEITQG